MAKKHKCECPDPGLTAPFYMLTYGDMMTLLLTFFVLLFSMSTLQTIKFQAQLSVMQGSLGISELYQHAPMQKELPAPAVKKSPRVVARSEMRPTKEEPLAETAPIDTYEVQRDEEQVEVRVEAIRSLGVDVRMMDDKNKDEVVITLPTYGVFRKGEWEIDFNDPEVQRVGKIYRKIARKLANLSGYTLTFTGHTDAIPFYRAKDDPGPHNNVELGFTRATALFEAFFSQALEDRTRISFASQGDNVPLVPSAKFDSEHIKNRRVEIAKKKIL